MEINMYKLARAAIVIAFMALLSGCVTSYSIKSESNVVPQPDEETAVVVFMRSSFILSGVSMNLYEKAGDELSFVGTMIDRSKVAHRTTPGKKVFMTHATAPDFMVADLEANKTYYVIVRPIWPSRFAPTPVRTDGTTAFNTSSEKFVGWRDLTDLYEIAETAEPWFSKEKENIQKIYAAGWAVFEQKTDEQKQERTLRASDGI